MREKGKRLQNITHESRTFFHMQRQEATRVTSLRNQEIRGREREKKEDDWLQGEG